MKHYKPFELFIPRMENVLLSIIAYHFMVTKGLMIILENKIW